VELELIEIILGFLNKIVLVEGLFVVAVVVSLKELLRNFLLVVLGIFLSLLLLLLLVLNIFLRFLLFLRFLVSRKRKVYRLKFLALLLVEQ
jgi:hypothetical protein